MKRIIWIISGVIFLSIITFYFVYFLRIPHKSVNKTVKHIQVKVDKPQKSSEETNTVKIQVKEDTKIYDFNGSIIGELKKGVMIDASTVIKINIDGNPIQVMHYGESGTVKLSALDLPNEPEGTVDYSIINHSAFRFINNKKLEIKFVVIFPTGKSGRQYFILDDSNPFKLSWEKPGAYFFDPNGKFLFMLPIGYEETSGGIDFSPNEKYIAQDDGTWVLRELNIFTFPDMKKMGSISYLGYSWKKDDYIIFTTVSSSTKPQCPLDLSAYQYVALYNIKNEKETPVQMNDDLTEYSLKEETDDYLILEKTYVEKIEDWANTDLWKKEEVKIPNPLKTMQSEK